MFDTVVITNIYKYLNWSDFISLSQVNRKFRKVSIQIFIEWNSSLLFMIKKFNISYTKGDFFHSVPIHYCIDLHEYLSKCMRTIHEIGEMFFQEVQTYQNFQEFLYKYYTGGKFLINKNQLIKILEK